MDRFKEFVATGEAPDGRLYAGDLLLMQDLVAALEDFTQTIELGVLKIGEDTLQLLRYGSGEARLTGKIRVDGILRALGGFVPPTMTTAQRDALGAGLAPYGLHILNTTLNKVQWNKGTDVARDWTDAAASEFWSPYLPTADEKAALAGTSGHPDDGNRYVTNDDDRIGGEVIVDDLDGYDPEGKAQVVWLRIGSSPPYEYEEMFYDPTWNRWSSRPRIQQVEATIFEQSGSFAIRDGFSDGSGPTPLVIPWGASRNDKGLISQMKAYGFLVRAGGTTATMRVGWRAWNLNDGLFADKTTGVTTIAAGEQTENTGTAKMVDTGWQDMDGGYTVKDWLEIGPALKAAGTGKEARLMLGSVAHRWVHTP